MSETTCEFCFAQFTSSAAADAETVKCPDCGEETSALTDHVAESAGYSSEAEDADWSDDGTEEGESESYGFAGSDDDDAYETGTLEVTGEVIPDDDVPTVLPKRRKKKKSGKRKKKKKAPAQSSTNGAAQIVGSIIDILTGYPKVIAGILVWAVFMVAYSSGAFESREQEVFHNLTGEGRTTGEWLTVVRNYEEQNSDGQISTKAKSLYMKISKGINTFLGPDPAAIPDLFQALQEDPERSQLPQLAEKVLDKFRRNNKKALVDDLEDGLESGHPKVILWSIRLLAMHGTAASGSADAVAEFSDSDDQEIVAAAGETLAKIR
jgi:hypothetical protein